ncbi:MAG: transcription antitermination factor NusB [Dysosmobacter sp.]
MHIKSLYLDRVPDSAAVNTSVELAKISGRGQASGLVNAVLARSLEIRRRCRPSRSGTRQNTSPSGTVIPNGW